MAVSNVLHCVCWEWQRDDGGFSPYPPDTSAEIEAAYSKYYHSLGPGTFIPSGALSGYAIDFVNNVQKRHGSGKF